VHFEPDLGSYLSLHFSSNRSVYPGPSNNFDEIKVILRYKKYLLSILDKKCKIAQQNEEPILDVNLYYADCSVIIVCKFEVTLQLLM